MDYDYYRFVESRDIQSFMQKTGYQFTTLEAAYLIWNNQSVLLDEKFQGFETLIDSWPNCSVADRPNTDAIPDFHAFLRKYIDLKKRQIRQFKEPCGEVYFFRLRNPERKCIWKKAGPYSSFDKCMEDAFSEIEEMHKNDNEIIVTKYKLNRFYGSYSGELLMDQMGRVKNITLPDQSYEDTEIDNAFKGMWFDFPTPFETGDILHNVEDWDEDRSFVLSYINTWDTEKMKNVLPFGPEENADERVRKFQKEGDQSLMCACGYGLSGPQDKYSSCLHQCDWINGRNYLRQEYCRMPLKDEYKALQPVSRFLKKEIDLVQLMNEYEAALHDIRKNQLKDSLIDACGKGL